MDYQGSSEEKQLLLFPILQVPLCTEGKENWKSEHAKQEQRTKLSSKEGQMPVDDWKHWNALKDMIWGGHRFAFRKWERLA